MKRRAAVLLILTIPLFSPAASALDPYLGTGWSMTRLDLEVRIDDSRRQLFPLEPHGFVTKNRAVLEFEAAGGIAAGFTLTLPDGRAAEGVRVESSD